MKKLALLLFFVSVASQAVEEITGAFGFKFGEVFDMSRTDYVTTDLGYDQVGDTIKIQEGVIEPFDEYILHLHPKTHEIVAIKALLYDDKKCTQHIEAYLKVVSNKYALKLRSDYDDYKQLSDEDFLTSVMLMCNLPDKEEFSYHTFQLIYIDRELSRQADKIDDYTDADNIDTSIL